MPSEDQSAFRFNSGPIAAHIAFSRGVSSVASGRRPTCMLERASPDRRHPVDGARKDAVDQDDALVAPAHFGKIALHDDGLAIETA